MTIRQFSAEEAKNFWLSLSLKPKHALKCRCDICLYFSQPKKPHFSRRTFFMAWLVHRIKLDYLKENKKAQRFRDHGEWAWKITSADYDKAPFRKKLKEILAEVYDLTYDEKLIDCSIDASLGNYIKRSGANKFIDFKDSLILNRRYEWLKTQPRLWKSWKQTWDNGRFYQRIINFIRSQPGQKATQRELERHFSNKRKANLERAFEWLFFYPNLRCRKKGKSIIFSWKKPTKAKIKTYNQKVADEVRAT